MEILEDSFDKCVVPAMDVCKHIDIPHFYIDLKSLFSAQVIQSFCKGYEEGLTPNPCVACNAHFKFGMLWDALDSSFSFPFHVASGHYARCDEEKGVFRLSRATDPAKDQSYFLSQVSASRLPRLLLPLGELNKAQTRELAREGGLSVAEKKDSMEICFTGDRNYREILDSPAVEGAILDVAGKRMGTHKGITHYTLGQRKGLQVSAPNPLYVVKISPKDNTITVAEREHAFSREVVAHCPNILDETLCKEGEILFGKIRSSGGLCRCRVTRLNEMEISVLFDEPQFAPAPGQTLALYSASSFVVAGATISTGKDSLTASDR